MTPVMPGFSGFVPPAYAALNPNVSYLDTPSWNGFPATYVPAFTEVMQMLGEGAWRFRSSIARALVASVRGTWGRRPHRLSASLCPRPPLVYVCVPMLSRTTVCRVQVDPLDPHFSSLMGAWVTALTQYFPSSSNLVRLVGFSERVGRLGWGRAGITDSKGGGGMGCELGRCVGK